MSIGERIRKKRIEANLTLEELAGKIGISRQTMSRYETGVIGNIPSDKIEAIAKCLYVTPAYLMGWNDGKISKKISQEDKDRIEIIGEKGDRRVMYVSANEFDAMDAILKTIRENQKKFNKNLP